ncbi:MAG: hypothetical protein H0X64_04750 [Gemmatimonadaceae bacterium]|nr:hypothetical protein [Gemmatimonadaceae bacterium]
MRAREIKPCAGCGRHPLHVEDGRRITFFVLTVDRAVLDERAARSTLGLAMHFGSDAAGLADVFSPDPEIVKTHPQLRTVLHLCEGCAGVQPDAPSLFELLEREVAAEEVEA